MAALAPEPSTPPPQLSTERVSERATSSGWPRSMSSRTTSALPAQAAHSSGVAPLPSSMPTSCLPASESSSTDTTSLRPLLAATCSAVCSMLFTIVGRAPLDSSSATMSDEPAWHAKCSGVQPSSSCAFTRAP